jgi:filamentous hemagglutinin
VSVVVDGSSSANGTVTSDNAVVQVTGSAVANLTVGSASSSSSLAFVTLNQQGAVTVTAWKNNAAAAKVDNNAALTVNWLTVGNTWFSVWHNTSASASAGVTFQNIDFSSGYAVGMSYGSGTVHVAGGTVSVNGPGVKGSGTLKLTGGASVSSTGGSLQGVTIDISSQGQSAPVAVVDTTLDTSGDITASAGTSGSTGMTSSSAATLVVNGQLTLSATSSKVQPKVVVSGSANSKLTINSNASSFTANDVWVGANGYLELGANTYAAAQQGKVMFNNLWLDAQGNVKLTQSVAANAASKAGNAVIAFNYSASVNVTALAQATVWLVDSTGVSVKLATSASATMGRRLLAGSSTATWGSNGMSYSYAGSGGSSANGAVKSFVAVPIVVISLCGLMM